MLLFAANHFRSFRYWWAIPAIFFVMFSASVSANQLLPNPGFENSAYTVTACPTGGPNRTGTMANGWFDNSCWTGSGTTLKFAQDASNPHSGAYAQRVELYTGTVQVMAQTTLALQNGRSYSGKIWMRAQSPMTVTFALQQSSSPYTRYASQTLNVTTSWAQYSFTLNASTNANALLLVETSNPGILWMDDATLDDTSEILPNPGFEGSTNAVGACASGGATRSGAVANGWYDNSCWTGAGTTVKLAQDSSNPHSGSYSQRVELYTGTTQIISQADLALTNGRTYSAKVWMRAQNPMSVTFALQQSTAPYTRYAAQTVNLTTSWAQYTLTATLPTSITGLILVETSTPGIFWIDDGSLVGTGSSTTTPTEPVDSPVVLTAPTNTILANSGFETQGSTWASVAPGWSYYSPQNTASFALDTNSPHGGSTSQRITLSSGKVVLIQSSISLQQGTRYTAAVWMRAQGSSGRPMHVVVALKRLDNGFSYLSKTVIVPSTWTQYIISGYTESTTGQLTITTEDAGQLWVDDATMAGTATGLPPTLTSQSVPQQFFGLHMHQQTSSWAWPSVRFGSRRIWDTAGAQWPDIATCSQVNADGTCATAVQYNWSTLDSRVNQAIANGVDLVMNLGLTPTWASARPTEASPYGLGKAAEPKNDQVWRDWVTAAATRYKGKIKYWEVWNEPNFDWLNSSSSFYTGTPEKLASLQQQAYTIVKGIDSTNMVLTPGFADMDYLGYFMSIGGAKSADIVAYHFYVNGTPEAIYQHYSRNVRILADTGKRNIPVWNTEQGWLGSQFDQQLGASYVARSYILNWATGISRYYFYAWDNHAMGVQPTQSDNVSLTPAGVAYGQVANWLVGQQLTNVTTDSSGNWIVQLSDPGGNRGTSYILWNPSRTGTSYVNFTVPSTWSVSQRQTLDGGSYYAAAGQSIQVNYSPVLLRK